MLNGPGESIYVYHHVFYISHRYIMLMYIACNTIRWHEFQIQIHKPNLSSPEKTEKKHSEPSSHSLPTMNCETVTFYELYPPFLSPTG